MEGSTCDFTFVDGVRGQVQTVLVEIALQGNISL